MPVPFTDAPLDCLEGRHDWETEWDDGPDAWCLRCGASPGAPRELRRDP